MKLTFKIIQLDELVQIFEKKVKEKGFKVDKEAIKSCKKDI